MFKKSRSVNLMQIETELNLILPEEYKEVMCDYPFNNPDKETKKMFLYDSKDIIKLNDRMRTGGYAGEKWPESFFCFGYVEYKQGEDLVYFMNTTGKSPGNVYVADGDKKFNPKAIGKLKEYSSIKKLVRDLLLMDGI